MGHAAQDRGPRLETCPNLSAALEARRHRPVYCMVWYWNVFMEEAAYEKAVSRFAANRERPSIGRAGAGAFPGFGVRVRHPARRPARLGRVRRFASGRLLGRAALRTVSEAFRENPLRLHA